jgi:hypothetical protein
LMKILPAMRTSARLSKEHNRNAIGGCEVSHTMPEPLPASASSNVRAAGIAK